MTRNSSLEPTLNHAEGPALSRVEGFTLIELMVAISIVALLAIIALYTYSTVLKSSRDNQRKQALNSYQQALEIYRRDNGHYPTTLNTLSALVPTYVSSLFADPLSSLGYNYNYAALPSSPACDNVSSFCTSYCLYATLENFSSPISGNCALAAPSNTPAYNYSVSSP